MTQKRPTELLIVRSLAESDLGIFEAHRSGLLAKQRAININAAVVSRLLTPAAFKKGEVLLECICKFQAEKVRSHRLLKKTHKNWRLGGPRIREFAFSQLDAKDFVLIRSLAPNDGSHPVMLKFVSRKAEKIVHAGLVTTLEDKLRGSMAVFTPSDETFAHLAKICSAAAAGKQ